MEKRDWKLCIAMTMMWIGTALLFPSGAGSADSATAPPALALPDLYRLALTHAETIRIVENDMYIAEKDKDRAFSLLVPGLSAYGGYRQYRESKIEQPESYHSYGMRIDQSFTLNGRELIGFHAAKDRIRQSRFDVATVKADYLFQVTAAYYDILKADKRVKIAEANVERLGEHKDAVQIRLKMSEVPKTELFMTEAELSGAESDRVVAKNRARLARATLARLVNVPAIYQLAVPEALDLAFETLPESSGPEEKVDPAELRRLQATAFEERSELRSQQLGRDIAEKRMEITKGRYWPVVSIEGVYEGRDADPEAYAPDKDTMYVGLNLQYLLYDWGDRKAEVSQDRFRLRQAELAVDNLKKQIAVEVEEAYYNLITARSAIVSLSDAFKAAKENYFARTQQFKYGLTDSLNVTDANTLMLESEINLVEAYYQKALAESALERAQGVFLEKILADMRLAGHGAAEYEAK